MECASRNQRGQVIENGTVFETTHPWAPTKLRQARPAAQFSNAPFELRYHAPLLGEHTREVLKELGGATDAEVDEALAVGVVVQKEGKAIDPSKKRDAKLNDLLSG